jgi:hypothetical protein
MHEAAGLLGIWLRPMFDEAQEIFGIPSALLPAVAAAGGLVIAFLWIRHLTSDLDPLVRGEARWRFRDHVRGVRSALPGVLGVLGLIGLLALAILGLWLAAAPVEADGPRAFPLRIRALASICLAAALLAGSEVVRSLGLVQRLSGRSARWWAVHLELAIGLAFTALVGAGVAGMVLTGGGHLLAEGGGRLPNLALLAVAAIGSVAGLGWMWRIYRSAELSAPAAWRYRDRA